MYSRPVQNYRTAVAALPLVLKMSIPQRPSQVPRVIVNRVAGAVDADPRTVRKVIDGQKVRGPSAVRIEEELKRRGLR